MLSKNSMRQRIWTWNNSYNYLETFETGNVSSTDNYRIITDTDDLDGQVVLRHNRDTIFTVYLMGGQLGSIH